VRRRGKEVKENMFKWKMLNKEDIRGGGGVKGRKRGMQLLAV
jgi:hypothetical protein